jgi:diguanylate cyclase (GGDEF)-like protein/PAS domain S-box-containing protein
MTWHDAHLLPQALQGMVEGDVNAEAPFAAERAQLTLNSIGDAVMSTDLTGKITYLNRAAERITGWSREAATGHPVEDVYRIIDGTTREAVQSPTASAIREDKTIALPPNCVLIRRDGVEVPIEDSAAPVRDHRGHVTGAVMVFRDVSTTRALALRMAHQAQHDVLTDLPNRLLLKDRITQAMALARRQKTKLALLFLDLDRFKHINDSLGHDIGDRLLQAVARRLLGCVRGSDTVSRHGGDEFVVLLSQVRRARDAAVSAEKILLALGTPHRIEQHDLHLTASMGIATYPEDGADAQTLMKRADLALLHSKDAGGNSYRFFKPGMNARAIERQLLEQGLRHAVACNEFVLHFQPQVDLKTGAILAAEALVRWRHPQRGLVPPAHFIPVAQDCGLMVPIGRWVLHEACRQARVWQQDPNLRPIRIAVNISTAELSNRDFVAAVRDTLTATGLAPRYLELELTESFLMQDASSTVAELQALKRMGVRLALDDFGTGYASLTCLKRFPIGRLKIDQSCVRDLADDASLVRAMISMGNSLGMRVVAEGIATRRQRSLLQQEGCPEGQGFHFSRPLLAAEFSPLLGCHALQPPSPRRSSEHASPPRGERLHGNGSSRLRKQSSRQTYSA